MGAVVALDPASGDILAMVSTPAFDLNAPAAERTEFNRAVRGQYPPGSVFKIVTAAAGLESGAIQPGTVFTCTGSYKGLHCWDHAGHGPLDLTGALAHSCNVYFMKTADRVGVEPLAAMARRFGLGQPLNIDDVLSGSAGNVPDPAKGGKDARQWGLGETLQMGIGQADVTVTPLQSACVVAAIANGGKLVHPRVILRSGATERPASAPVSLGLSPSTIQAIDRGLRAVVNEGTASRLDPRLQIAGKTGTAQNSGADHAWFVGYAPADHPTIAIAVLVEHGGHGGVTAAPIAETVIQAYTDEHGLTRTHTDRH
jgi:penicillin-binding protein 2